MAKGDEVNRKLITEEHKTWKENMPFLYDLIITRVLEWPSLTVEWFPDTEKPAGEDCAVQKVILGTHTFGGLPNYLVIAQVQLPLQDYEVDIQSSDHDRSDFGDTNPKVLTTKKINHDGEVNRARSMPQDPHMIATMSISAEVYLFDSRKHPSMPLDGACSPDLRLMGHTSQGFGLSWSYFKVDEAGVEDVAWNMKNEYLFGSVGDDKYLHLWDLREPSVTNSVQSVAAHLSGPGNERILVTGSSDMTMKLFDLRKIGTPLHTFDSHYDEVTQVGWNPKNETILASSCAGRRLLVWDLSRIDEEQTPEEAAEGPPDLLFIHGGHTSKISDFSWHPCEDWIMASVADDNILQIWQMAEHIYDEDEGDCPPDYSTNG